MTCCGPGWSDGAAAGAETPPNRRWGHSEGKSPSPDKGSIAMNTRTNESTRGRTVTPAWRKSRWHGLVQRAVPPLRQARRYARPTPCATEFPPGQRLQPSMPSRSFSHSSRFGHSERPPGRRCRTSTGHHPAFGTAPRHGRARGGGGRPGSLSDLGGIYPATAPALPCLHAVARKRHVGPVSRSFSFPLLTIRLPYPPGADWDRVAASEGGKNRTPGPLSS